MNRNRRTYENIHIAVLGVHMKKISDYNLHRYKEMWYECKCQNTPYATQCVKM